MHTSSLPIRVPRSLKRSRTLRRAGVAAMLSGLLGSLLFVVCAQAAHQASGAGGISSFFRGLFTRGDEVSRIVAPHRAAVRAAEKRLAKAEGGLRAAESARKKAEYDKQKAENRIAALNKQLAQAKNEKERARVMGGLRKAETTAIRAATALLKAQQQVVRAQKELQRSRDSLAAARNALKDAQAKAEKQVAEAKAAAEKARNEAEKKKRDARLAAAKRKVDAKRQADAERQKKNLVAERAKRERLEARRLAAEKKARETAGQIVEAEKKRALEARQKAEAERRADEARKQAEKERQAAEALRKAAAAQKSAERVERRRREKLAAQKAQAEERRRAEEAKARKAAVKRILRDEKRATDALEDALDVLATARKTLERATRHRDAALKRYTEATGVVTARAADVEHARNAKAKKRAMRALTKAQAYAAEAERAWQKADKGFRAARDALAAARQSVAQAKATAGAAKLAADRVRKERGAATTSGFWAGLFGAGKASAKPVATKPVGSRKPALPKTVAKKPVAPKAPAKPQPAVKKPATSKRSVWARLFPARKTAAKTASKRASVKPTAKKPAPPKIVAKKPVAPKPPAKRKPAVKKPATGKRSVWARLFPAKKTAAKTAPKRASAKPTAKKPTPPKVVAKKPVAPKPPAKRKPAVKRSAAGKRSFWAGLLPAKRVSAKTAPKKTRSPAKKATKLRPKRKPEPARQPKPILIPVKRIHETNVSDVTPWTVPIPEGKPQLAAEQKLTTPSAKPGNVAKGEKTVQFDVAMLSGDKDIVEKLKVWKDWSDYLPFNPVTIREINEFHGKLVKALQEEGYVFAKVTFPTRIWAMGIFLAKVDCGPLGTIIVKGNRHYSAKQIIRALQRREGDRFNYARVHGDLFDLNTKPDITVNTKLKPVIQDGRRVINAELDVKDNLPIHAAFEASNTGTKQTNDWRFRTTLQHLNLTKHDDVLSLDWLTSPDWNDINAYSGSYFLPVNDRYSLNIYGGYSKSNITDVMPQLDVRGKGTFFGGQITRTFWDTPTARWQASAGWIFQHTETHHDVPGLTLSQRRVDVSMPSLTLGYASRTFDGLGGRNFFSNSIMANFAGTFGSSEADVFNAQGAGNAGGNFVIDRFQIARLQHFFRGEEAPGKWSLFLKLEGQLASDTLIPELRKSVGGLNSVRGYIEDDMSGDQAVVATLELRTPLFHNFIPGLKKSAKYLAENPDAWQRHRFQFLLFTDFGYVDMKNPLPGEQDTDTLLGVGAGLRLGLTKYSQMSLDIGYPLEKTEESDNPRAHLSLQLQF
ncbi:MAG: BamA/TamA family outer membrane protein [Kiritimatiellaeota bacterium]|nr:BamA/TamA family outer membrane protein [Kiritimatiellota bacterium]